MKPAYIIGAARTPIGKLLGKLSTVPAPMLAATTIRAALARSGVAADVVGEVILGNVLTAGVGQAPARQAALAAGIPAEVGAVAINKVCGSGLKAVMLADQAVRLGEAEVIVAGGMESMSLAPYLLAGGRNGWKFGHRQALDSMLYDGLWCSIEDVVMGSLADSTAEQHSVARADQDAYAAESHRRAASAQAGGKFDDEIAPVTVATRKGETIVDRDEGPRAGTTAGPTRRIAAGVRQRGHGHSRKCLANQRRGRCRSCCLTVCRASESHAAQGPHCRLGNERCCPERCVHRADQRYRKSARQSQADRGRHRPV